MEKGGPQAESASGNTSNARTTTERNDANPECNQHSTEEFEKPRYDDPVASTSKSKSNIQQVTSFADLPIEMHEKILHNVTTSQLLTLRLVNQQWNEISSVIVSRRDNVSLHFAASGSKNIQKFPRRLCKDCSQNEFEVTYISGSKSLTDLTACLDESSLFPVTSFRFDQMTMESFQGMTQFLTIWGDRIRTLRVSFSMSTKNFEILVTSLFGKLPNLKELTFAPHSHISTFSNSSYGLHQLQLPKLDALCIYNCPSQTYGEIIEDIINSSPNLKTISITRRSMRSHDLEILHKTQKLNCLTDVRLIITEELIAYWKRSQNHFDLRLQSLTLSFENIIYRNAELNASASEIVSHLLHSSRTTLQMLQIQEIGPLTKFIFPKLEQLRYLLLRRKTNVNLMLPLLPASFDWVGNFPMITKLDVGVLSRAHEVIFDRSLTVLPTIEILRVTLNRTSASNLLGELIKRTPNVKTLTVKCNLMIQHINFEDISTHLPKLTKLRWTIHSCASLRYKLDAMITGLPKKFCKKLAPKFRDVDHLTADETSRCWKRCNPSILDLKELRHLDILFDKCASYRHNRFDDRDSKSGSQNVDKAGFHPESIFYKTGITKISKLLVFDQMPHLNVTIGRAKCYTMSSLY